MKEAKLSKSLLIAAIVFLAGALVLYSRSGGNISDTGKHVLKEIEFARAAYAAMDSEIAALARKAVTSQTTEILAEARMEFERNLASIVDGLRVQAKFVGVGQNANEVRTITGVNAKSTVERAEDLARKLTMQSGMLLDAGSSSVNHQRAALVTNALQKSFNDSKQRQATALAGMLKENVDPKLAKRITDKLPDTWKDLGKAVSLDDDAAKKALKKAEKEEKKVADETRRQMEASASGNAAKSPPEGAAAAQSGRAAMAQSQTATGAASLQAGMAMPLPSQLSPAAYPQQSSLSQDAGDTSLKLDVVDEVLMAYRDRHMPNDGDSSTEIWNKMRWMLKMGFDGRALDCLDGYRSACLAESGAEELDDLTRVMTDSAEKFIKGMRDLEVSGGVMVSSIIKQDVAAADEANGRESYHIGDIITSIGTNACCSVDALTAHYAEGEPVQLYYLQETGVLTNMMQEASGQDLGKTYQFKEISK